MQTCGTGLRPTGCEELVADPPSNNGTLELKDYLSLSCAPLVVVAHPDDEVLGVGGQLGHWPRARFIHATDGSPRDLRDARLARQSGRAEYAELRKRELREALALAGFPSDSTVSLGWVDQEASTNLALLTQQLLEIFCQRAPEALITHPYEGGHPDHDAVAFGVRCACELMLRRTGSHPPVIEMTSYHNANGWMRTGEFLPCDGVPVTTLHLAVEQQRFKRRLLRCYASQEQTLRQFKCDWERFRLAPKYDFTQAPHAGTLFYEQYRLGMDGRRWRDLARTALLALEVSR